MGSHCTQMESVFPMHVGSFMCVKLRSTDTLCFVGFGAFGGLGQSAPSSTPAASPFGKGLSFGMTPPSTSSSPFGGFGQQPSTPDASSPGFGVFGQSASAFGQTQAPGFGQPQGATPGASGGFGAFGQSSGFGRASGFGQPSALGGGFGQPATPGTAVRFLQMVYEEHLCGKYRAVQSLAVFAHQSHLSDALLISMLQGLGKLQALALGHWQNLHLERQLLRGLGLLHHPPHHLAEVAAAAMHSGRLPPRAVRTYHLCPRAHFLTAIWYQIIIQSAFPHFRMTGASSVCISQL